jgi:hypothetical protein
MTAEQPPIVELLERLRKGEWWRCVVQGPNPTGFTTDETETVRAIAALIDELVVALEGVLQKALQTHDAWDIDDAWRQWEDCRYRAETLLAKVRGGKPA